MKQQLNAATSKLATTISHSVGAQAIRNIVTCLQTALLLCRVTKIAAPAASTGTTRDRTLLAGRSDFTLSGLR